METELERILAKLTESQKTLVKGWHRQAQCFKELCDNVVLSSEIMINGKTYVCRREAKLHEKKLVYSYRLFSLHPMQEISFEHKNNKVDPNEYVKNQVSLLERAKVYGKK